MHLIYILISNSHKAFKDKVLILITSLQQSVYTLLVFPKLLKIRYILNIGGSNYHLL